MAEDKTIIDQENVHVSENNDVFDMSGDDKPKKKLSTGAIAGIGVGAAALAAAGVFIPFKLVGKEQDSGAEPPVNPDNTGQEAATGDGETSEHDFVSETTIDNYTPTASDLPIATGVNDDMDFNEAFASARDEVGAGGMFYWHGSGYGTYYENEWNNLSPEDKADYWASVNHSHSDYVQHHDNPIKTDFDLSDIQAWLPSDSYVVDANGNELPDVIVDVDGDGVGDVLLVDVQTNDDGSIASVASISDGKVEIKVDDEDIDIIMEELEDGIVPMQDEEQYYEPEDDVQDYSGIAPGMDTMSLPSMDSGTDF